MTTMSDNNFGWGRSTTVIVPEGQQAAPQPAFDRSIGASRRGTVYVTAPAQEQRGPGLVAQDQTTGGDINVVRRTDQGNKSLAVRAAPTAEPWVFMDPTGNFPIARDVTVKDTVNVPGLGTM